MDKHKDIEIEIRVLEGLAREILTAKRPDGQLVADVLDAKEWLQEKIKRLRRRVR